MPFSCSQLCFSLENSLVVQKQQTLAFKEQVRSELLVMGAYSCAYLYAQRLLTKILVFVFQKDLMPDFGVFGFVNNKSF